MPGFRRSQPSGFSGKTVVTVSWHRQFRVPLEILMTTPDPDSPTVVAADLTDSEAMVLIDHLRQRGIDAHPWGSDMAALHATFAPSFATQVVVRQSDAESARQAVLEIRPQ